MTGMPKKRMGFPPNKDIIGSEFVGMLRTDGVTEGEIDEKGKKLMELNRLMFDRGQVWVWEDDEVAREYAEGIVRGRR